MSYGGSYGQYGQYGGPPSYQTQVAGGFAQRRGPPHGADPQLWSWFVGVDLDGSGAISVAELQRALINGDWSPFDLDTIKLLMTLFDVDRSGTIGFNEFSGLWKYIKEWQGVFRHFDRDRSGTIDGAELQNALQQFGYRLSPQLLDLVQRKYASGSATVVGPGGIQTTLPGITFDRFVRACVVVKQITETFTALDTDRDGWVQLSYDQFLQTVLSLP